MLRGLAHEMCWTRWFLLGCPTASSDSESRAFSAFAPQGLNQMFDPQKPSSPIWIPAPRPIWVLLQHTLTFKPQMQPASPLFIFMEVSDADESSGVQGQPRRAVQHPGPDAAVCP